MNFLLALLSSLLFTLCLPHFSWTWLAPIALAPLLFAAARERRPLRRLLIGWLAGAGILFGVVDWIRFVISVHGGLGTPVGWAVFLLFCAAKGFYFGVFAMLAGPLMRRWWAVPAVAAVWVGVDITVGSIGFQWVTLGNAGLNMGLPMRLAPYTGVHGISFVFMMMTVAITQVLMRRPRAQLLWLLPLPLLILLPDLPAYHDGTASATVVQPNVDETLEWSPQSLRAMERELGLLSIRTSLSGKKPDLVVWPEVPAPFYFYDDSDFRDFATGLAKATNTNFLFGTVAHTPSKAPLNSALLVSPKGDPVDRYDKIHLVPFGEYVPWPFGFAGKITAEVGDFEPGTRIVTAQAGSHKIASFICYESAFPALVRQFVQNGAEVLFNLSNDGYFGRSESAREQHLSVVRMRAAENARWIIRSTNDGITAAVDPAGRVVERLPSFVETAGLLPYSYRQDQTVYTRFGDWFGWTCVVLGLAATSLASRAK